MSFDKTMDTVMGIGVLGATAYGIFYFIQNPGEFPKVISQIENVVGNGFKEFDNILKGIFNKPTLPTTPPVVNTGLDNNGVRKIYPTVGGKEVYTVVPSHNPPDRREWEVPANGLVNVEATAYISNYSGNDQIAIKMRGGDHNKTNPKYGCSIGGRFPIPYDSKNNAEIECEHPIYDFFTLPPKFQYKYNGTSIGVKAVLVGSYLQLWCDENGLVGGKPSNTWKLWAEGDVSKLGSSAFISKLGTNPFGKAPIYGTEHKVKFRMDVPKADISHVSVREVSMASVLSSYAKLRYEEKAKTNIITGNNYLFEFEEDYRYI